MMFLAYERKRAKSHFIPVRYTTKGRASMLVASHSVPRLILIMILVRSHPDVNVFNSSGENHLDERMISLIITITTKKRNFTISEWFVYIFAHICVCVCYAFVMYCYRKFGIDTEPLLHEISLRLDFFL